MNQVTVDIPEKIMERLQNKSDSIQSILIKALEDYLIREKSDITKTETWELCGSLEIPNPEPEFIASQSETECYTNYSEQSDRSLY